MNPLLQNINEIYQAIQQYIAPSPTDLAALQNLDAAQQKAFFVATNEARHRYGEAVLTVQHLLPTLTPDELIEGYTEGTALLQRNISGYMVTHFQRAYIPLMTKEVQHQAAHTGATFLRALVNHMGQEASPLIIECLVGNTDELREVAMVAVAELRLHAAVPIIRGMMNDTNPSIREVARQVVLDVSIDHNEDS